MSVPSRLAAVLGARLEDLTAAHLESVPAAGVREDEDLDFKAELYGNGESDKRELAGDVGALANTVGGVIILGVSDVDGAADGAPGVELSDAEERRMTQALASSLAPLCRFYIRRVEATPGHGFYVIEVPRSPDAPHAVRVNDALRYPRRLGTTTAWLTETQVADAYRNRFLQAQARVSSLDGVYGDGVEALGSAGVGEHVWLTLALLPDQPGTLELRHAMPNELAISLRQRRHPLMPDNNPINYYDARATTGLRRVIISQNVHPESGKPRAAYWQLHTDGAGFGAIAQGAPLTRRTPDGWETVEPFRFVLDDEELVVGVAQLLDALAGHATETCHASGPAIVRAALRAHNEFGAKAAVVLSHPRGRFRDDVGVGVAHLPSSEHSVDLDAITGSPTELLVAARAIVTDVVQALGRAECWQIDGDGRLRHRYWSESSWAQVGKWASAVGVEHTEEVVT